MKTLQLKSRYFDHTLDIRMSDEKVEKLFSNSDPIELINFDLDTYKMEPKYAYMRLRFLTESQCRRILSYFGKDDCNHWRYIYKK